jgi:hypothetical protein
MDKTYYSGDRVMVTTVHKIYEACPLAWNC